MSTATETKTVKATKGVQVHATIDQELFTKLEDHRWTVRLNMVDVVKLALTQYADREGLNKTDAAGDEAGKHDKA
jgi:hypothetical protein